MQNHAGHRLEAVDEMRCEDRVCQQLRVLVAQPRIFRNQTADTVEQFRGGSVGRKSRRQAKTPQKAGIDFRWNVVASAYPNFWSDSRVLPIPVEQGRARGVRWIEYHFQHTAIREYFSRGHDQVRPFLICW